MTHCRHLRMYKAVPLWYTYKAVPLWCTFDLQCFHSYVLSLVVPKPEYML